MNRCHERDKRGMRCTIVGEHRVVDNSAGIPSYGHQTSHSAWLTPVQQQPPAGSVQGVVPGEPRGGSPG